VIGIIGGTGFIGLNLSWHLQKEAVPRRTFSRNGLLLSPKSIFYPVLSTIEHVKGDFRDRFAVREFVKPCREVVVLVSHLLPSSSAEEMETVISWFSPAFIQLLESCLTSKIAHLIFVSSGGTIYGENPTREPITEGYPLNPKCAYGSFCAFLEQLLRNFHYQHGLPFTILRLGNLYGLLKRPNDNQGIIDQYIRSARRRQAFTLFGDGSEVRDYIYVNDISRLLIHVLRSPARNDTFNIGTGQGHTSKEVIELLKQYFDLPEIPILSQSRRLGDVGCSLLNMDKFERLYRIRAETTLTEGLQRYADLDASA
jgi:UDP-glucose 4-epimerase